MKSKSIYKVTSVYGTWRWLSGIAVKQSMWLLGSLSGRGGYEAWMTFLIDGLQDPKFIAKLEETQDPWLRSRIVGEKISALAKDFAKLSGEQKDELAKRAEIELKAGIEMLSKEKKHLLELLKTVTAPLDD